VSIGAVTGSVTDGGEPWSDGAVSRAAEETNRRTLLGLGVEFTEEPTDRPYGTDCGLRDPFGNRIRFTQPKA
jgi:hypothetical protein